MPLMKTPAGDMDMTLLGLEAQDDQLVAVGQMGAWSAHIYFTPKDILGVVKLLNWGVIALIVKMPVLIFRSLFNGK
jgi:hypothetical protein